MTRRNCRNRLININGILKKKTWTFRWRWREIREWDLNYSKWLKKDEIIGTKNLTRQSNISLKIENLMENSLFDRNLWHVRFRFDRSNECLTDQMNVWKVSWMFDRSNECLTCQINFWKVKRIFDRSHLCLTAQLTWSFVFDWFSQVGN